MSNLREQRETIIKGKAILFAEDNFPYDDQDSDGVLIRVIEQAMMIGAGVIIDEEIENARAEIKRLNGVLNNVPTE